MDPVVVASLVSALGVLAAQHVADRLRDRAKRMQGSSDVQIRRIDAEGELRAELRGDISALKDEIRACQARCRALEVEKLEMRAALIAIEDEVRDLHRELESLPNKKLAGLALTVLDRVRQGRQIGGAG